MENLSSNYLTNRRRQYITIIISKLSGKNLSEKYIRNELSKLVNIPCGILTEKDIKYILIQSKGKK
jgi:hypothetical protein